MNLYKALPEGLKNSIGIASDNCGVILANQKGVCHNSQYPFTANTISRRN